MGVRALLLACFCSGAILLGTTATAGPLATPTEYRCGDKAVTVLFWPKGHGVIRSTGWPATPSPHVELYRYAGSSTYKPANAVGFADVKGPTSKVNPRCKRQPVTAHPVFKNLKSSTAQLVATCAFPGGSTVQTQRVGQGWDVKLLDSTKNVVLRAQMKPAKSILQTTSQCSLGKSPS